MVVGYLGEIRILSTYYTPKNWIRCEGQILPINGNEKLFGVIGNTYGGDGRTEFGVPDLRGRIAMHRGSGRNLSHRKQGEQPGSEWVTLTTDQIPNHSHTVMGTTVPATSADPSDQVFAASAVNAYVEDVPGREKKTGENFVLSEGSDWAHSNLMPYLVMQFCMCIDGAMPQRP